MQYLHSCGHSKVAASVSFRCMPKRLLPSPEVESVAAWPFFRSFRRSEERAHVWTDPAGIVARRSRLWATSVAVSDSLASGISLACRSSGFPLRSWTATPAGNGSMARVPTLFPGPGFWFEGHHSPAVVMREELGRPCVTSRWGRFHPKVGGTTHGLEHGQRNARRKIPWAAEC